MKMNFRCFWCDSDLFEGVNTNGETVPVQNLIDASETAKDYVCEWCGHLSTEPNPRGGDPEETVESLKEERDDIRLQLTQCEIELGDKTDEKA